MVDDWCRFLPRNFEVILGVPRGGLMVAERIALNFGVGLATPKGFLEGDVWFSSNLSKPNKINHVLVVDDTVEFGRQLFRDVWCLRNMFPSVVFESAALVKVGSGCSLDFFYCGAESFIFQGDVPKVLLDRGVARLEDLM